MGGLRDQLDFFRGEGVEAENVRVYFRFLVLRVCCRGGSFGGEDLFRQFLDGVVCRVVKINGADGKLFDELPIGRTEATTKWSGSSDEEKIDDFAV